MKQIHQLLYFFCVCTIAVFSQDTYEQNGYLRHPVKTPEGVFCTNNFSSAIYQLQNNRLQPIISSSGCGTYFSVNKSGTAIGYKNIVENGLQFPVVYDVAGKISKALHEPVKQCGQVSFADNGMMVYSIGKQLVLQLPDGVVRTLPLANYANLTPVSPDARYVVYNNEADQLLLMDVATGEESLITDPQQGCFLPVWSPDGKRVAYSSLNGVLYLYDLLTKNNICLGAGESVSWIDNTSVIFSRKQIDKMQLLGAELCRADIDGSVTQLTTSPSIEESDPFYDANEQAVYFTSIKSGGLYRQLLNEMGLHTPELTLIKPDNIYPQMPVQRTEEIKAMSIPYVHQVYDTPNWFNGHSACGATTAIMAIAYYNLLPKWDGICSTPSVHYNSWGRYVSDKYNFQQMFYYLSANDPNDKPSYGGYGYTWSTGSPHTRLAGYFSNHGMTSQTADNPSHQMMINEVNSGYPYAFCVGLTSAGHIVLVHGIGAEQHSLVVNDPYGDKNKPGYPNYYGKNATYDWPGYNNGFQNFQTAYWVTSCRYTKPAVSDTLVDDLQLAEGFTMNTAAPATMDTWRDYKSGYRGHCWFAYSKASGMDTCFAEWRLPIKADGNYELSAFIPGATSVDAVYKITHANGVSYVHINQVANINKWAVLGRFYFLKGSTAIVRLGDGSSEAGKTIAFDAVKFIWQDNTIGVAETGLSIPTAFVLEQNFPNPFNPATNVQYALPQGGRVHIALYDVLGTKVKTIVDMYQESGVHQIEVNGSDLPSGVYLYRLECNGFVQTRKMTLLK